MPARDTRIWISRASRVQLRELSKRYHRTMKEIIETLIDVCIDQDLMKPFEIDLRDGILQVLLDKNVITLKKYMELIDKPLSERSLDEDPE